MVNTTLIDLLQAQLLSDVVLVRIVYQCGVGQFELSLFAFLCQDVTLKSVLSFNFSSTR